MPKPLGSPKTGGRKKGTANKKTQHFVEAMNQIKLDPLVKLAEILPKLEPRDQAAVLVKLLEFIYPRRKAIEYTGANDGPIQYEVARVEPFEMSRNDESGPQLTLKSIG